MYFIYSINPDSLETNFVAIHAWLSDNDIDSFDLFAESGSLNDKWTNREIGKIANNYWPALKGIAVFNILDLGTSSLEVLEICQCALQHNLTITVINNSIRLSPEDSAKATLSFAALAASSFENKIKKPRKPGRPVGTKAKELKLDKHIEQITDLLNKGVSKASIAKIIGCSRPTLYAYLIRIGIRNKT